MGCRAGEVGEGEGLFGGVGAWWLWRGALSWARSVVCGKSERVGTM